RDLQLLTFLSRGFFFFAEAEARRAPAARMAPALSLEMCWRRAIPAWTALNPGCFGDGLYGLTLPWPSTIACRTAEPEVGGGISPPAPRCPSGLRDPVELTASCARRGASGPSSPGDRVGLHRADECARRTTRALRSSR